jgi:hypothetical protein
MRRQDGALLPEEIEKFDIPVTVVQNRLLSSPAVTEIPSEEEFAGVVFCQLLCGGYPHEDISC